MDHASLDIQSAATCTTCTFSEDLSNYWTAVLYFKSRNGTYARVPLTGNIGFESANGGMTVYYLNSAQGNSKVTAFQPVSYLSTQFYSIYQGSGIKRGKHVLT